MNIRTTIKCDPTKLQQLAQANHMTLLVVADDAKPDPMLLAVSDWLAISFGDIAKIMPISDIGAAAIWELLP